MVAQTLRRVLQLWRRKKCSLKLFARATSRRVLLAHFLTSTHNYVSYKCILLFFILTSTTSRAMMEVDKTLTGENRENQHADVGPISKSSTFSSSSSSSSNYSSKTNTPDMDNNNTDTSVDAQELNKPQAAQGKVPSKLLQKKSSLLEKLQL